MFSHSYIDLLFNKDYKPAASFPSSGSIDKSNQRIFHDTQRKISYVTEFTAF
ncbi:MAG: hypothetical protein IK017_06835 [Paludibacteraceae bacterium]|nr:hypothetical protein [Paludibacteraceae bacterium]